MTKTYEEFKNTMARLRSYEKNSECCAKRSDYLPEILLLKAKYPEYAERLKLEEVEK